MSIYSKAILIHGLCVLGTTILVLIGGAWYGLHRVRSEKEAIQTIAEESRQLMVRIEAANGKLKGRRDRMAIWDEHVQGEVVQHITGVLQDILDPYEDDELRQIGLSRPTNRSMLAGSTENTYSRFEITFEGGYGPMQEVLAELETRIPNLVLEEFAVEPTRGSESLSFRATYMCWSAPTRSPLS